MSGNISATSLRSPHRRGQTILAALLAAILIAIGSSPVAGPSPDHLHQALLARAHSQPHSTLSVIIQHQSDVTALARAIAGLGGSVVRELPLIHALVANVPASRIVQLARLPGVTWVAEDAAVEDHACLGCVDTTAAISSWLRTTGAAELWSYMPAVEGQGVTVAVLDSGVTDHEDLRWSSSARRVINVKPGTISDNGPAPTGLLSAVVAPTSSAVNVSAEGSADWARWSWPGYYFEERPWHQPLPQQISQLSYPQLTDLSSFSGKTSYTWNAQTSNTAVALSSPDKSFQLSVRADRTIKTLKLYVAASQGDGRLEAYLSDGSALPFTHIAQVPVDTTRNYVYTLTYNTLQDNEKLIIRWAPATPGARVAIAAATLVNGGVDPRPVVTTQSGASDQFGHGTHVAGIIGGNGAASGGRIIGVAPMVNLINVRVNDAQGKATVADVVAGLEWIYNNSDRYNIRVVNISLNSSVEESYHTSALDAAVELLWFKGIVVVVSAGNNGDNGVLYPPANDPFVITVGATDERGTPDRNDDVIAPFSARGVSEAGTAKPEIVAPGVNIVSLACSGCVLNSSYPQNQASGFTGAQRYFRASGTSMSAAIVSGAVALMLQQRPTFDPDQVKQKLIDTGYQWQFGYAGPRYLQIAWAVTAIGEGRANTGLPVSQAIAGGMQATVWDSAKMGWGSAKMGWGSANWASAAMQTSMTYTTSTMSADRRWP